MNAKESKSFVEMLEMARKFGKLAFDSGTKRDPYNDSKLNQLIKNSEFLNQDYGVTICILTAWRDAWDKANLSAPPELRYKSKNELILSDRTKKLNQKKGIRVGDFLKLSNGTYLRFSHDWGDSIQTATEFGFSSFYLDETGCDFSGGLNPDIDKSLIKEIDEIKNGDIWFFKNDYWIADNKITFEIPFRVYELTDKIFEEDYINKWVFRKF